MRDVDLTSVHNLSGPIRVEDASGQPALPGDLLCVEICDLSALPGDAWCVWRLLRVAPLILGCCIALLRRGFTGVFDRDNGGGFLTDHFPCAAKAIWQLDGVYATSRHSALTPASRVSVWNFEARSETRGFSLFSVG